MGIKVVKFGIVGLGRLGLEHAKNLAARIPGAKLTALCDVDEQNLIKVGGELDVAGLYTDFEKMCKEADIDAVVIVSPSAYHTANIETAMNYGKHVFSEKPLDVSIERCKEAEKIVEAHPDLKFQIGYMRRYDNSYRIAKQRLDAG
ncbi:MAG: Gfo/Idh/MocA family oxidoreductase, partial [Clostridiales Family XIII bacterium]|nr:Gfo/Idh/MocA family oxidoreductase [Clostridiales Family XIII bacterium]